MAPYFSIITVAYNAETSIKNTIDSVLMQCFNDYDVIITSPNFRFLDSILIGLFRTKFKTIGWNIGIRASYTKNYDALRKHTFLDWLYGYLMFKFDALIFYMEESIFQAQF